MLEISLYHHEITQRELRLISAAQAGRTITWLGRKYRPLRITKIAEPGKGRTELCFEPVGADVQPRLALTPENYKALCKYAFTTEGQSGFQKECCAIWERAGMPGTGKFVIVCPDGLPPALTIKE